MTVGLLLIDCILGNGTSLKEKRRLLLSLTEKIRNRFNVAITEVDCQNLWQRSKLAVVSVNTNFKDIESLYQKILEFLQKDPRVSLLNYQFQKLY